RPSHVSTVSHSPYTTLFRSLAIGWRDTDRRVPRPTMIAPSPCVFGLRDLSLRPQIMGQISAARQHKSSMAPWKVEAWWLMASPRSEEHTSELQSLRHLVCRL